MERVKYEIDPHNRLVLNKIGKSGVSKYRLSLDGYFKTGKDNSLQYHIKTPYKYRAYEKLPHRINLKGNYSLTKNHDILFTLRRSGKQRSTDTLLLKTDIIFAKENSLGLAVATRNSDGTATTRTFSLNGKWKLDDKNRILFMIKRERGGYDALTFTGGWNVNKNNEIEYSYTKARMKYGKKREHKLSFKGTWEIVDKNRIKYALGVKDDSGFELEAELARTGLSGRKNVLLYKLGTRLSGKVIHNRSGRLNVRYLKISGNWKLTRRTGLLFEVRYSNGRRNYLAFGAEVKLGKRSELLFLLKDKRNKPLGVEIALKRKFLGNSGEALLKLLASKNEKSITLSVGRLF